MRIMMQHARRGHAQTASARVYGPPPSNRPVATLRPRIKARTSAAAALSPGHGLQSSSRPPRTADRRPRHHLHQSPTSAANASLATTSLARFTRLHSLLERHPSGSPFIPSRVSPARYDSALCSCSRHSGLARSCRRAPALRVRCPPPHVTNGPVDDVGPRQSARPNVSDVA